MERRPDEEARRRTRDLTVAISVRPGPYLGMEETTAHALEGDDRWAISVPEVGRRLDISRAHAYRLVANGDLPSVRLGHRTVVPLEALRAILEEGAVAVAVADAPADGRSRP
jgi:excisionase family DNA binding protein